MNKIKVSRRLSFLLRHSREFISLEGGWAQVSEILEELQKRYPEMNREILDEIVAEDTKTRYSYDETGTRIRANQGHSVPGVVIEMESPEPPEFLYHGTATRFLDSILKKGLLPMSRQYVHLSGDEATARKVGSRHGTPVVLRMEARRFAEEGNTLLLSPNGIWLTTAVPPEYLTVLEQDGQKGDSTHEALGR